MKNISLDAIRIDGGTQCRVELNKSALADYAQALRDGVELPPVDVMFDGTDNWLADGFHRYHAYCAEKRSTIPANVLNGTVRSAVLYSVGANGTHGLRRSNADKRKAVMTLLADAEWSAWSNREIAERCGVGHPFVAALRDPGVAAKQQENRDRSVAKRVEAVESDSTLPGEQRAPEQEPAPAEEGPTDQEIADAKQSAADDLAAAQALLAADAPLAEAVAEVQRLKALTKSLELRITGLIGEKDAAIRSAKSWQRKYEQAMKQAA